MAEQNAPGIRQMVLIAGRKQKDKLVKALCENGGHFFNICYGRGSVKARFLMDAFGLVPEENKVLITFLLSEQKVSTIFDLLINDFQFDKPNTGIAYTIPVEKLSF